MEKWLPSKDLRLLIKKNYLTSLDRFLYRLAFTNDELEMPPLKKEIVFGLLIAFFGYTDVFLWFEEQECYGVVECTMRCICESAHHVDMFEMLAIRCPWPVMRDINLIASIMAIRKQNGDEQYYDLLRIAFTCRLFSEFPYHLLQLDDVKALQMYLEKRPLSSCSYFVLPRNYLFQCPKICLFLRERAMSEFYKRQFK
jgi:hypothetical protein